MRKFSSFFAPDTIPAETYEGVAEAKTLALGAQWVTSEKADPPLVYEIAKALYDKAAQKQLASGHVE